MKLSRSPLAPLRGEYELRLRVQEAQWMPHMGPWDRKLGGRALSQMRLPNQEVLVDHFCSLVAA